MSWKTLKITNSFSRSWKCPGILQNQAMPWKKFFTCIFLCCILLLGGGGLKPTVPAGNVELSLSNSFIISINILSSLGLEQ